MFQKLFLAFFVSIFAWLVHTADQAILGLSISDPVTLHQQEQAEWLVSPDGNDSAGDGSPEKPFRTIQHAIDVAQDGDVVVVLEGLYSGPGNRDLDYQGKAITVRSRDPEDNNCLRNTIIDAEGQGVIVRFINDEGPDNVFSGFTLRPGDVTVSVRGTPGFFEFSENARPTTERLRIDGLASTSAQLIPSAVEAEPPYGGLVWDGNNPFHQPANTTDYHGSGDVDKDGLLTLVDRNLVQEMANGSLSPSYRGDVDGSGDITQSDISLIDAALTGAALPGHWNSLISRAQRNAWFDRFLDIDQTDAHPYLYWWVCGNFSDQLFLNGTFFRKDLFITRYNGGSTWFNIPLYKVFPGIGHEINAVLVGDNPLNFEDWRFIEPQNDTDVHPGDWNMPYGVSINIVVLQDFGQSRLMLKFYVDEAGGELEYHHPDLLLTRPSPPSIEPDNRHDLWNPLILPYENGILFYDRTRDEFGPVTDIHVSDLSLFPADQGSSLTHFFQYSRLLDAVLAPNGSIQLLWISKEDYLPGIFHGELDIHSGELSKVTRVSSDMRLAVTGRLLVTRGGETHVFWYDPAGYGSYAYPDGIYWTKLTEAGWLEPINLTPDAGYVLFQDEWDTPNILHSLFEVALSRDDSIDLVWVEPREWYEDATATVRHMHYDGAWGTADLLESTFDYFYYPVGVDAISDSFGILHIVYWMGKGDNPWGHLIHRTYDGSTWSIPTTIDTTGTAGFPSLTAGWDGKVHLAWLRSENNLFTPFYREYIGGSWNPEQALSVRFGASAWYPSITFLPKENNLIVAWSSRSDDLVTVETATIPQPAPAHLTINSSADNGPGSLRWAIASLMDGGTIEFDFTQPTTIHLNSGALVVDKTITIDGADQVTLEAGQQSRVFDILPEGVLTLKRTTITGGYVHKATGVMQTEAQPEGGGGIRNRGNLYLIGSVLKGNQADYGGGIHNSGTATISGSILMENQAANDGGGIYNDGELIVSNTAVIANHAYGGGGVLNWGDGTATFNTCEISSNSATNGGGLENGGRGVLKIQNNSTIDGNEATAIGGGIINYSTGIVEISDSTLSNNEANQHGGGIYNDEAALVNIRDSLLVSNHALYGGGVCNVGDMEITATQLSSNSAEFDGGGAFNVHGVLTITQSTFGGTNSAEGNHAIGGGGILNWDGGQVYLSNSTMANNQTTNGGAIENGVGGHVVITNSTLVNNFASSAGGGVMNFETGEVEIYNSTVVWNEAVDGENIHNVSSGKVTLGGSILALASSGENCSGAITSSGYNLSDDNSCNLQPGLNDLPNTAVQVNPLINAGGPTLTCPLQASSPAIDRIPSEACALSTDQRGVQRMQGAACDIGAYEMVQLSIQDASVYEGDAGTKELNFVVSYPGNPVQEIQFSYNTADGTAVATKDYHPVSGTLTISDSQTYQAIMVPVIGDKVEEPDEIFYVFIYGATNAMVWDDNAEGIIWDDDRIIFKPVYLPIITYKR